MSQPVKLSDSLVLDARLAGDVMQRSIAGQVEFWARLGRSLETLLDGRRLLELSRSGAARRISECLESVDSPEGRQRVAAVLATGPFPHYEQDPDSPGLLVRTEEGGRKTIGRFVNRQFQPLKTKRKR
jgi:ParD-like antitoxin of type II ParDE toxin-antitoxin system